MTQEKSCPAGKPPVVEPISAATPIPAVPASDEGKTKKFGCTWCDPNADTCTIPKCVEERKRFYNIATPIPAVPAVEGEAVAWRHRERPGFPWAFTDVDPSRHRHLKSDEIQPLYLAPPSSSDLVAALEKIKARADQGGRRLETAPSTCDEIVKIIDSTLSRHGSGTESRVEGEAVDSDDLTPLLEEGLEILNNLIDSIKRHGNYSAEATCAFIDQAGSCLREALRHGSRSSGNAGGRKEKFIVDEAGKKGWIIP